ncbi:hypothetical protein [Novosphingobium sp. ZW T3_23]|uniref:hypothetical protein n=1 Tax=Novosphingobium sp. ZW T3_23 TaxID=3378084 RepID=UPI003855189D
MPAAMPDKVRARAGRRTSSRPEDARLQGRIRAPLLDIPRLAQIEALVGFGIHLEVGGHG